MARSAPAPPATPGQACAAPDADALRARACSVLCSAARRDLGEGGGVGGDDDLALVLVYQLAELLLALLLLALAGFGVHAVVLLAGQGGAGQGGGGYLPRLPLGGARGALAVSRAG